MRDSRLRRLAQILVDYSVRARPDEVVLISGAIDCQPLLTALFELALQRGARPLLRLHPDLCLDRFVSIGANARGLFRNPLAIADGEPIRCSIGIWNASYGKVETHNQDTTTATEEFKLQSAFLDAAAVNEIRWAATIFPTPGAAKRLGLSALDFEQLVAQAGLLDHSQPTIAWQRIQTRQQELCQRLERVREIRIRGANGTDLHCQVAGRHWISGAGQSNLPDGEVFTAPQLAATTGVFAPNVPVWHEGQWLSGIRLRIRDGHVVDASADSGEDALIRLLSRDAGASRLGELGLGLNFGLRQASGCSLLDEKLGGSAHIALGTAYPATGGENQSSIHRDLVLELRPGGSITVDGQPLNEAGRFVATDWPRPESWGWIA